MKKNKTILFIVFFVLYITYYLVNSYYINNKIEAELNNSVKDLRLHYEITKYHNKRSAQSLYETIIKNKTVINILKQRQNASVLEEARLREKLYNTVLSLYKSMENAGLNILQFSTPDNKSFLRVHKKDSHSDDLSIVRPSISIINKNKKELAGFEQGKVSHAFRHIYPVYDENKNYLGAVDFGFSSESVQNILGAVNKIHTHFLVNKKILSKRALNQDEPKYFYNQSIEHKNYLIAELEEADHEKQEISKWTIQNNLELINEKIKQRVEFSIYGKRNSDLIVISFIPISSIKKLDEVSAYLVSYTSSEQIISMLKVNTLINVLVFMVLLSIIYVIYKQVIHKKELHDEVLVKTKAFKELNENLEEKIRLETLRNRQKDKQLHENVKKAQMGEMLGNIAHQWRQPLSVISTISSGLKMNIEFGLFDKDNANKDLDKINTTVQHLSETIEVFRDYIKSSKELKVVPLQERVEYSISLVEASLENNHIKLNKNISSEDIKVELLVGELSQVIINILNNAKDVLVERDIKNKFINLDVKKENNTAIIIIEDNAGGIDEEIQSKIFDPYFTTKHQSQGTGIGLYMSLQIIEKQLGGKIHTRNSQNGAVFYIEIPIYKKS